MLTVLESDLSSRLSGTRGLVHVMTVWGGYHAVLHMVAGRVWVHCTGLDSVSDL